MTGWTEMSAACVIWREAWSVAELVIPRFTPPRWHECDVLVVMKKSRFWHEFEVKLSVADFRADKAKVRKHRDLEAGVEGPNRFSYVVPDDIAARIQKELPEWAGLVVLYDDTIRGRCMNRFRPAPLRHRTPIDQRVIDLARRASTYRMWAALSRLEKVGAPPLYDEPELRTISDAAEAWA